MTRRSGRVIGAATLGLALCASLGRAQEPTPVTPTLSQEQLLGIATEVRRQMVTLPQYGVFDNIHFGISPGGTVVLRGEALYAAIYNSLPLQKYTVNRRLRSPELRANQDGRKASIVIGREKLSRVGGQQAFLLLSGTTNSQDIEPGLPRPPGMNPLMIGPRELLVSNIEPQRGGSRTIVALRQGKGDSPHCINVNHSLPTGPQRDRS